MRRFVLVLTALGKADVDALHLAWGLHIARRIFLVRHVVFFWRKALNRPSFVRLRSRGRMQHFVLPPKCVANSTTGSIALLPSSSFTFFWAILALA